MPSGTIAAANEAVGDAAPPSRTVYIAREILTLDPGQPHASAVAVLGDRIVATGTLEELIAGAAPEQTVLDRTFKDKVIVPGFIAQHDHPFLSAMTMIAEIIAIEDWRLPTGTFRAARGRDDYLSRLEAAYRRSAASTEPLVTWGWHPLFHGPLARADLDALSSTRPIIVIHRSWHELIVNTPALALLGVNDESLATLPQAARDQIDLAQGHFSEGGLLAVTSRLLPAIAPPERLRRGLEIAVRYMHANGITLAAEPGGFYSSQLQQAQNAVLSAPSSPFRYLFIPDGRAIHAQHPDDTIAATRQTLGWGEGMTRVLPGQVKLFADGAVYSQLMQLSRPYLDGHHGEWMVPPEALKSAFRVYWDAGYQIHVHVTGDAGIDLALDTLEENMKRNPRYDHRTVLVHFAVSRPDQIRRIRRLGAIVSANPYYVTALAERFAEVGLGTERAKAMVRLGDLEAAGIPLSYHSDLPMAPAQPLLLMDSAVNRRTQSGWSAAKDQRASREAALAAVTLGAAYSLRMENEVGSIAPGKLANFTILDQNPVTVRPDRIKDIHVWGTVQEGRILPAE